MKKKHIKKLAWILSLLLVAAPLFSGCGIFNPPLRDNDGYYIAHFNCCGPVAIEKAINQYYRNQGILFKKNPAPRKEVSKHIQDDGQLFKGFLALIDREAVCVTWAWEMKAVVKKYGFRLISVNDFASLDPSKDVALVLVRGNFFSDQWHWLCYPVDKNITDYFDQKTEIDKIYLMVKE